MYGLSKKAILKANQELLDLHKRVITTYLTQRSLKNKYIKKFFIIYDDEITPKNIRNYFHRPVKLFVKMLLRGELSKIEDYIEPNKKKRKKR